MLTQKDVGVVITRHSETMYELYSAIESVILNNVPPENICVVNDNPQHRLLQRDFRKDITIINNSHNVGPGIARNIGIDCLDKKLICFLDADDTWKPNKVDSQLAKFNTHTDIKIVSTGMNEVFPIATLKRIPHIDELNSYGNPVYLSSIMWKRDSNRFNSCLVEDRDFVQNYDPHTIYIINDPLIDKYNLTGRRGQYKFKNTTSKAAHGRQTINLIIYKIRSIKKIRFTLIKYLLVTISKYISVKSNKRNFVSINWKAAEYKNLSKFAKTRGHKIYRISLSKNKNNIRNPYTLRSNNFREYLASLLAIGLVKTRYIYVGLPGAGVIYELIRFLPSIKTIHITHGRTIGDKFLVPTSAAITAFDPSALNAKKIFRIKPLQEFSISSEGKTLLIHGYRKGKRYGINNLIHDYGVIKKYNIDLVKIHPLATLLKIYCCITGIKTLERGDKVKKIYSLSPSYNCELKDLGFPFVDLRDD